MEDSIRLARQASYRYPSLFELKIQLDRRKLEFVTSVSTFYDQLLVNSKGPERALPILCNCGKMHITRNIVPQSI